MSNNYFQFKQFTIRQEHCAMKVNTDGVLIGAIAPVGKSERVLDVGTGTGVIALMMAQRCNAHITGIEIEEAAVVQAIENVNLSPWSDRVDIISGDFKTYCFDRPFDCIVSNPPFFEDMRCAGHSRNIARHTDALSFDILLKNVRKWLSCDGNFVVILPTTVVERFIQVASVYKLYPSLRTIVYTLPNVPPKRTILIFSGMENTVCRNESLVIESSSQKYSKDFIMLMHDYYLYL